MWRLAVVFGGGRRVRKGQLSLSSRRTWYSLCLWAGDAGGTGLAGLKLVGGGDLLTMGHTLK